MPSDKENSPSNGSKSPLDVVIRLKFVYLDNLLRFCAWLTASLIISRTSLETCNNKSFITSVYGEIEY